MNESITLNKCAVKISISPYRLQSLGEVIYYRSSLTVDMIIRWRWYFEYLAALVKTSNPRLEVVLTSGPMESLVGEEYRQRKTENLLKAKISKLAKLHKATPEPDLFGFNVEDYENEEKNIEEDIRQLESGQYAFYVPPSYINRIKQFVK